MRLGFHIVGASDAAGGRIRLAGNPLAALLLIGVLMWLALFARSAIDHTWDHYSPYEGTVVAIERHWTDHLTSESGDVEHLLIRTPQGRLIDKRISLERRIATNIRPGDYVTKNRGFAHRIQRRDSGS